MCVCVCVCVWSQTQSGQIFVSISETPVPRALSLSKRVDRSLPALYCDRWCVTQMPNDLKGPGRCGNPAGQPSQSLKKIGRGKVTKRHRSFCCSVALRKGHQEKHSHAIDFKRTHSIENTERATARPETCETHVWPFFFWNHLQDSAVR